MEDLYEELLSQDIDEEQAAQLTVDYMGAVSYTHLDVYKRQAVEHVV